MNYFPLKYFVHSSHPAIAAHQSRGPNPHNNLPPHIRRVRKGGFDKKVRPPFTIENHWLLKIMTLKV